MTDYNFELRQFGFNFDMFKQKQAYILKNTISNSRLGYYLSFDNYANISFDENDRKFRYPKIEMLDDFNRNKTNCLVYNIKPDTDIYRFYNKVFVFQYIGKIESFYSIILYHTETGKFTHKFFIEYDVTNICISLSTIFNGLHFYEVLDKELELKKNIYKRNKWLTQPNQEQILN
jgi:hypothetical protein